MKTVCVFNLADGATDLMVLENAFYSPKASGKFYSASGWSVFSGMTESQFGHWHTVESPVVSVVLAGSWEVQVSSEKSALLGPGDILFAFDTIGKGHRSKVVSTTPCTVIGIGIKTMPETIIAALSQHSKVKLPF